MQRLNLSFICVLLNVIFGFSANSFSNAQMFDSKLSNQDYDVEKVIPDYSVSNHDISQFDEPNKAAKGESKEIFNGKDFLLPENFQRNSHIKWFVIASKPIGDGRQSILSEQPFNRLTPSVDRMKLWPFISRQLTKKTNSPQEEQSTGHSQRFGCETRSFL